MNFSEMIPKIVSRLDDQDIQYALIGSLAMALHGIQRATLNADFILLSENLSEADQIITELGYTLSFRTKNVSTFESPDSEKGRIDILHAFRTATKGMLNRAKRLPFSENCSIPVVNAEDIIGLKIQAANNDRDRATRDWSDIEEIVRSRAAKADPLDRSLITDYLLLFDQGEKLSYLKGIYGSPD